MVVEFRVFGLLACWLMISSRSMVIDVTEQFDSKIASLPVSLVKFYAPWCGHCKSLAPDYQKASDQFDASKFAFAEVDCTKSEGKKVCESQQVQGYPTLKLFRSGKFVADYDGGRSFDSLVDYANRMSKPASSEIDSVEKFTEFINEQNPDMPILFGFFADDATPSELEIAFRDASKLMSSTFKFGFSRKADVAKHAEAKQPNSVYFYRAANLRSPRLEPFKVLFEQEQTTTAANIEQFAQRNKHGLCGLRTTKNAHEFAAPTAVLFTSIDLKLNKKAFQYVHNRMIQLAKQIKDLTFAVSDQNEFKYALSSEYGLELDQQQQQNYYFVILDQSQRRFVAPSAVFADQKTFPVEAIKKFIGEFKSGSLKPYIKSEVEPAQLKGEDGVSVLVGTTAHHHLIEQTSQDVLIEFYAPWCGHCKSLAPIYSEVAKHFQNDQGIMVAKMDATANDHPREFDVKGFPTIYFVPANRKHSPIRYEEARTQESMVKFISKHRSTAPKQEL